MNASQSAFYDMGTILLIWFNLIFMVVSLFYFENIWICLLSVILMFIFVPLRRLYTKKWDKEFSSLENEE